MGTVLLPHLCPDLQGAQCLSGKLLQMLDSGVAGIWRRLYFMGLSFNKQLEKLLLSSYEQFKQKCQQGTLNMNVKKKVPNPFNTK